MNVSIGQRKEQDSEYGSSILVTVEEASRLLHIGRTTAYELVMLGLVPSVKIGRRRLVVREGLQQYVDRLLTDQSGLPNSSSLHSIAPIA
jgi:excisionase family DNA binding protein